MYEIEIIIFYFKIFIFINLFKKSKNLKIENNFYYYIIRNKIIFSNSDPNNFSSNNNDYENKSIQENKSIKGKNKILDDLEYSKKEYNKLCSIDEENPKIIKVVPFSNKNHSFKNRRKSPDNFFKKKFKDDDYSLISKSNENDFCFNKQIGHKTINLSKKNDFINKIYFDNCNITNVINDIQFKEFSEKLTTESKGKSKNVQSSNEN